MKIEEVSTSVSIDIQTDLTFDCSSYLIINVLPAIVDGHDMNARLASNDVPITTTTSNVIPNPLNIVEPT